MKPPPSNLARTGSKPLTPLTLVCLLALAGCSVGPDYHRPTVAVPDQWKTPSPWKEAAPRDAEIKPSFWELYNDPTLTALELKAIDNNPNLHAAFDRVEEARAVARISRADLLPSIDADPSYSRTYYSANRPLPPKSAQVGYAANDFVLPLDLSYEVDLWGRVRRSFRAAREQAQASAASYQNVLLSLESDLAQTYFTIRSIDLDRQVLKDTIKLRQRNVELVHSLHEGGAQSALDVARAETELASAQADLVGFDLRRAQLENAMAILVGQDASSFSIGEAPRPNEPPAIPSGLPADLLERRPDIAQAERLMAAASEQIGVAKSAFFPTVVLTGAAGVESAQLTDLFNWESRAWSVGPAVSLPIFQGGRIRAGLQQTRAAYDEATQRYRSQVLVAFREVEDGLIGLRLLRDQYEAQARAVDAASKAAELSRIRYKEGLVSYFEVVDAERTLLDNQILAYDLNGMRLVTSVSLIKALGGGWSADTSSMMKMSAATSH
jgi:outer membrane protein, multidrug efflux system